MRARSLLPVLFLIVGTALAAELRPTLIVGEAPAVEDEAALWGAARNAVTPDPVWRYLDRFPKGRYSDNARQRLGMLGQAPGRRFDGQWSGEVRCGSGAEWQQLALDAEIDNGKVRTRRGARGNGAWWDAAGAIWPDGGIEEWAGLEPDRWTTLREGNKH